MPFGIAHTIILRLAKWGSESFFDRVEVINGDNVPKTGPVLIACTHHNMMVDPVVLSTSFPHGRRVHYWAKSSLFANPIAKKVLLNAGNVPVDRKSRDNQVLFKGTFDALSCGEVVAIFPEGTSYTEPRVMQIKDGVSWTALEYYKWLETPEGLKCKHREVTVVPVSIVYADKSRYRSSVAVEYGPPIRLQDYAANFMSGANHERDAVKTLTKEIGTKIVETTINAPNWETLLAARMARRLLWQNEKKIPLSEWVAVNQTLVDLFCTPDPSERLVKAQTDLLTYYTLLKASRLTNSALSQLPLPRTLDPNVPAPLPSRLRTLWVLFRDTVASLLRLPFFLLPLLVHIPAYIAARLGARMVEEEEETQAQNKLVFALLSLVFVYPAMFAFLWALLWMTPPGFIIASLTLAGFAVYHTRLIDDNYEHAKRLLAAWRVLIGVWGPRRWDIPESSLRTYTTFVPPPPNPWLDINKPPKEAQSPSVPVVKASKPLQPKSVRKRRLPSRHLVRHVLRARLTASESLAEFLAEVERSGANVRASVWLAERYPIASGTNTRNEAVVVAQTHATENYEFLPVDGPQSWRSGTEVIRYLRSRGAVIRPGDQGPLQVGADDDNEDGAWAAGNLSSGDDGVESDVEEEPAVHFVTPISP